MGEGNNELKNRRSLGQQGGAAAVSISTSDWKDSRLAIMRERILRQMRRGEGRSLHGQIP